jgi:hypothetical protein
MQEYYRQAMKWMNSLDKQDWLLVLVAAVVIGFFALQGMGSRKNY